MSTTTNAAALTVDCLTCFATIGDPCRSRPKNHVKGAPMPTCPPHATRVKRAAEVAAQAAADAAAAKKRKCTYCSVRLTSKNHDKRNSTDLCTPCFDQAGVENEHADGRHADGERMNDCATCNPELDRANRKPVVQTSHADCDHPSTKAGRAACRRERAKAAATVPAA